MGKKENAFLVLIGVVADIFMYYSWYTVLYPTEIVTHFAAVFGGSMMMFFTLLVLGFNALIYHVAIAKD